VFSILLRRLFQNQHNPNPFKTHDEILKNRRKPIYGPHNLPAAACDIFIKKFLESKIPVDKSGIYDVFISYNTVDLVHAKQVQDFLNADGFSVFLANDSIPKVGVTDYRRLIDDAIEHATHMIVVASSRENVESRWVEAEWGLFINEIRAGRKVGNLLTIVTEDLNTGMLPISLRGFEVISLNEAGLLRAKSFLWRNYQTHD
nr:toll/interleukin-1 receptor domain-containing protein [Candidatus Sigynarchaeota archaeon]